MKCIKKLCSTSFLLTLKYYRLREIKIGTSTDGTCAVALTATVDFTPDSIGTGRGFAWMQSRGIRIYISCYISRNDMDANFANFLGDIEQSLFAWQTRIARLSSEATLMPGPGVGLSAERY
ncbi:Uncharacterized protein FWK35_00021514 [Aphis craccivora]|uniref:Uncharacterized protein n=1 Tax=Aphis craccivora TaxID=307492 RepID=A0A6G0Z7F3_APHCR|nr:Uncharacterized protein FWK35_00021514 [Aphis craccivora]